MKRKTSFSSGFSDPDNKIIWCKISAIQTPSNMETWKKTRENASY